MPDFILLNLVRTPTFSTGTKNREKVAFFCKKTKNPEAAAAADAKVSSIGSQIEGQKGFLLRLPDFHDLWPLLPRIGKITDRSGSDFYRGPEMALRKGPCVVKIGEVTGQY